MMQRGKLEWTKQITEIIDNKQIAPHYHGVESTSYTFMN